VRIEPGDVVLLRTGWLAWYKGLDDAGREALKGTLHPGEGGWAVRDWTPAKPLQLGCGTSKSLPWPQTNVALEALPVEVAVGFQHRRLIALQGMPIGEVWIWTNSPKIVPEMAFMSVCWCPRLFNLPGGVGSPPNAYAIKLKSPFPPLLHTRKAEP